MLWKESVNSDDQVNNTTDITKIMFVLVPSQDLNLHSHMSLYLLYSVIFKSEVIVRFVDIDGIVYHHGLNFFFHDHISHRIIEYKKGHWLNIFMFCMLQHGKIEET